MHPTEFSEHDCGVFFRIWRPFKLAPPKKLNLSTFTIAFYFPSQVDNIKSYDPFSTKTLRLRSLGVRGRKIRLAQTPQAAAVQRLPHRAREAPPQIQEPQPDRRLLRHRPQGHLLLLQHQLELHHPGRGPHHQEREDAHERRHQEPDREPPAHPERHAHPEQRAGAVEPLRFPDARFPGDGEAVHCEVLAAHPGEQGSQVLAEGAGGGRAGDGGAAQAGAAVPAAQDEGGRAG